MAKRKDRLTVNQFFDEMVRLETDLMKASKLLGRDEARYLVDMYYSVQDFRIQAGGQVRASEDAEQPSNVLEWVYYSNRRIEDSIKKSLDEFSSNYAIGNWCRSIIGIGEVLTAGLMAHIDIRNCLTAGQIWKFSGLDPTCVWEKKTKRPWNAKLKVLCWKIGESFKMFQNHDDEFYGSILKDRKTLEMERNRNGMFELQAKLKLETVKIKKTTGAYKWYSGCLSAKHAEEYYLIDASEREAFANKNAGSPGSGIHMLPPDHIASRARRYAVKMFLSHLHTVMYWDYFGSAPPAPYIFEHSDGNHRHYIHPPNFPGKVEGHSLKTLFERDRPEKKKGKK